MNFSIRKATYDDQIAIANLISESVRGLSREDYSERQIDVSIRSVFGVDLELISDETYFVAESKDGTIIGCGGWGKRRTLYGASNYQQNRDSGLLDPAADPAKIRAFFVHPDFARRGIGTAILEACETEAKAHGFESAEMMATLPGVKFSAVHGYESVNQVGVPVGDGEEIICIKMRKALK